MFKYVSNCIFVGINYIKRRTVEGEHELSDNSAKITKYGTRNSVQYITMYYFNFPEATPVKDCTLICLLNKDDIGVLGT